MNKHISYKELKNRINGLNIDNKIYTNSKLCCKINNDSILSINILQHNKIQLDDKIYFINNELKLYKYDYIFNIATNNFIFFNIDLNYFQDKYIIIDNDNFILSHNNNRLKLIDCVKQNYLKILKLMQQ